MANWLTHPLHVIFAILLLVSAIATYTLGFSLGVVAALLAGVIFELGFWFTVFSSSKMIRRHEDHVH